MAEADMVRLNLTISDDLAAALDKMAAEGQTSKSDVLRKALTLFEVARDGVTKGSSVALVDADGNVKTRIVGL
jgi:metal-responsive CopG/Arc/MetJ family transcriptional regulator